MLPFTRRWLLSSWCLLLTRYTLLTTVAVRLLLSADPSTLLSDCCCSLHVIVLLALASRFYLLIFIAIRLLHTVRSRCLLFAVNRSLLADLFFVFTVIYWLLASRCLLVASRFLDIFFRTPLAACCMLHITICMLFVIPPLTNRSTPFASGFSPLIAHLSLYAVLEFLLDTRLVIFVSHHSLSSFGCCRLPAFFFKLLASC